MAMVAQEPLEKNLSNRRTDQKSPEDVEHEIERTREALTVKLSRLEEEVEGKVRNTVNQVSGQIRETVDEITGRVKDGVIRVQNKLDLRFQMERAPYRVMTLALGAGFAFGAWLNQRRNKVSRLPTAQLASAPKAGVAPIVKSLLGTMAMTAAQRMVRGKVDAYMHSLQSSPKTGNQL